jgi:hypothetical protein
MRVAPTVRRTGTPLYIECPERTIGVVPVIVRI